MLVHLKFRITLQDDRADQLKGLARLSAIVAGFSMSSFLEFNFDASTVPSSLLIAYGISTSLVVCLCSSQLQNSCDSQTSHLASLRYLTPNYRDSPGTSACASRMAEHHLSTTPGRDMGRAVLCGTKKLAKGQPNCWIIYCKSGLCTEGVAAP